MPLTEQIGELVTLQQEGKVRHLGLSEVTVAELEEVRTMATIVSVQNRYNLADRASEALVDHAEANGIGFIPWFPLATGRLARPGGPLDELATRPGNAVAAGAGLAPRPVASHAAHPGHVDRRPPRGRHAAAGIELTGEEMAALHPSRRRLSRRWMPFVRWYSRTNSAAISS